MSDSCVWFAILTLTVSLGPEWNHTSTLLDSSPRQRQQFDAESVPLSEGKELFRNGRHVEAADLLRKQFGALPPKERSEAARILYRIANYWLDDCREEQRAAEGETPPWWHLVVRLKCFLRRGWQIVVDGDRRQPLFDPDGRACALLELIATADADGPYADRALYLVGAVALRQENWQRADRCFTRLVGIYPESHLFPKALEYGIIARHLWCCEDPHINREKLIAARRFIEKAQRYFADQPHDAARMEFIENSLRAIEYDQADYDLKLARSAAAEGHYVTAWCWYMVVQECYRSYGQSHTARDEQEKIIPLLSRSLPGWASWPLR